MNTELEEAVRRALDAGGMIAPDLDVDLAGLARSRYLRRRRATRGLTSTAAVAATIVLMIGGTAVVRDRGTYPVATPTTSSGLRAIQILSKDMSTAEQAWPDAILSLPLQLPDYRDYRVIAQYHPGVYVVQVSDGTVYRYAPATGALVPLIAPPPTRARTAWMVDGEYAVADNFLDSTHPYLIWVADIASGQQLMKLSVPAGHGQPRGYAWADGALLWTPTGSNTIYSSRDPRHPMPGTDGYALTGAGAWATSVTRADPTEMRWWNLATGQRSTVRAPANPWNADYPCASDYCVDYDNESWYVANADGVQYRGDAGGFSGAAYVGDHFAFLVSIIAGPDEFGLEAGPATDPTPTQLPLCDLSTGVTALVTVVPGGQGHDILDLPDANFHKMVLNLAAIH